MGDERWNGFGARSGDVIVTCSSHPAGGWSLSRQPGPALVWADPDEALSIAAEFAFAAKVDVWLCEGDISCLGERNRVRESKRVLAAVYRDRPEPAPMRSRESRTPPKRSAR